VIFRLLRRHAVVTALRRRRRVFVTLRGGGVSLEHANNLAVLLDGAGAFLSLFGEVVSPLNTPTILPKNVFFFRASSSDWTPATGCEFPFVEGGGSAFSEFPPNMREKKPCTPPLWSQVSWGSVPATKAIV